MNKLVVLCGAPGSGKSYFSKQLSKKGKGHVYIVSSDALRVLICGDQANMSFDNIMWPMFYSSARCYSKDPNGIVVLDAVHAKRKYRIDNIERIRKLFDEVDLVYFHIDKDIVRHQNLDRECPIPEEALEKIFNSFEEPNEIDENSFDNLYTLNTNNFNEILEKISK